MRRLLAVLLAAGLALAGCSEDTGPPVDAPSPEAGIAGLCIQATEHTPGSLSGQAKVDSGSPLVAVWGEGDRRIVWRCGVPKPAALEPTSRCDRINGVGWFTEDLEDGYRFTTIGREGYIEVYVPHTLAPEGDVLNDLSGPVQKLRQVKPCV